MMTANSKRAAATYNDDACGLKLGLMGEAKPKREANGHRGHRAAKAWNRKHGYYAP